MAQSTSSLDAGIVEILAVARTVEAYMGEVLQNRPLPGNLREAAQYVLLAPGKRLRPVLILHSCAAVGGVMDKAIPAAAAMEMIHNFSLVHDDLPAMDDDDLRRGRPTLHKHTNEAMAILAGDLLNTLAFEVLSGAYGGQQPELATQLVAELAVATNNMIAGQVYDSLPEFEASLSDQQRLELIHRNKTGALIRASCRMGAMVGSFGKSSADDPVAALTTFGEALGLMFQIVDDLLDVTQTTEQLGKAAGKDEDHGKLTYPGVMGIDASRSEIERLRQQCHDVLAPWGENAGQLLALCDYMAVRQK